VNKEQAEKCRDLGAMALRHGDYAKATKMLEKSLQLYPLPGVEALLAHAKTKKVHESSNHHSSASSSNSARNTNGSNGNAARRSSSSTATPNGSSSDTRGGSSTQQQSGSDGRAYSNEQVLVVKKVLRAKEGGRGAHYRILEISNSASESEIKKAYRKLSLKVHPDKVSVWLLQEERRESITVHDLRNSVVRRVTAQQFRSYA
jgi:DnaJ domain